MFVSFGRESVLYLIYVLNLTNMKTNLIVIPYGDNDFWWVMNTVGNIVVSWNNENAWNKSDLQEKSIEEFVVLIHKTMKYVLSIKYEGSEDDYFKHLTTSSSWSRFSGSAPNIYFNEEAEQYLSKTYPDGNSEILVIDFRLPVGKQVYIY